MLEKIKRHFRSRGSVQSTDPRRWNRWSAPVDVLLRAVSLASSELSSWLGVSPDVQLTTERPGLRRQQGSLTKHTTLDPLEQTREVGFRALKRLTILLSDTTGTERVEIVLKRAPPVVCLSVAGADAASREELARRLTDILDGGAQRPRWWRRRHFLWCLPLVTGIGLCGYFADPGLLAATTWVAIAGLLALVLIICFFLLPDLEISEAGDTAFKRWGGRAVALIGVLVGAIAIYEFVSRK